jgi:hypothetical protein
MTVKNSLIALSLSLILMGCTGAHKMMKSLDREQKLHRLGSLWHQVLLT